MKVVQEQTIMEPNKKRVQEQSKIMLIVCCFFKVSSTRKKNQVQEQIKLYI